jgi:hypothetical protein
MAGLPPETRRPQSPSLHAPTPVQVLKPILKSAETLGSKATLEDHLSRFASCAFVGLAKAKLAALTSQNASTTGVDPAGVGTWETMVPNGHGLARWIWEIRPDGTQRRAGLADHA